MKGTLITLFALAAAPALASGLSKNTGGKSIYVGYAPLNEITVGESVATGSVAGRAAALADSKLATRATAAEFFCQLPTRDVSGAPANAANIDGVCVTVSNCFSNAGARAFTGVCPGNTDCCIKNDCAGPNSNSACVIPSLPNDPLPPGTSGRFVNGECPEDLACFQLV
ncbi:hypothetical protein MMC10_001678 [Thelotrema lepadinum]|nr:hypothetical protein [Thelotrema lepadinum]